MEKIIVTTTEEIPGKKIVKILGIVRGNAVQAKHIGKDIMAGIRNLVGGEIEEYSELISQSRDKAFNQMVDEAVKLGANAIIGMRFATSNVVSSASEVLAYGTAVKVD